MWVGQTNIGSSICKFSQGQREDIGCISQFTLDSIHADNEPDIVIEIVDVVEKSIDLDWWDTNRSE